MAEVPKLSHAELMGLPVDTTVIWCTPGRTTQISQLLPYPIRAEGGNLDSVDTLIVVGGGKFLDRIKAWRARTDAGVKLVAVPTVWGSGSEASNIAVTDGEHGEKIISIGERYAPDARAELPELAETLDDRQCRYACGDVWSHALEGALSPLADPELRHQFGGLVRDLLHTPVGRDPGWFELSARACSLQSRCGVGLVHGIAHQIEPRTADWGHARLCSTFLWPVMCFNSQANDKLDDFVGDHDIEKTVVCETVKQLFDEPDYRTVMPAVEQYWDQILRDPCTRTNSALVRKSSLDFFRDARFLADNE